MEKTIDELNEELAKLKKDFAILKLTNQLHSLRSISDIVNILGQNLQDALDELATSED